MHKLHEQIKVQLHSNNKKYKGRADQKKKEVNFEVGHQVLAHLRKEILSRGKYNKFKLKNIRPCKILEKNSANTYDIEIP